MKRIRRKLEMFQACRDILACLPRSSHAEVCETGVMLITSVLDYRISAIILEDPSGTPHVLAARGIAPELLIAWNPEAAFLKYVLRTVAGPSIIIRDSLESKVAESLGRLGLPEVCLAVPLSVRGKDGVVRQGFTLAAQPPGAPSTEVDTDTDILLLDVIAGFLSDAMSTPNGSGEAGTITLEEDRGIRSLRRLQALTHLHEGFLLPRTAEDSINAIGATRGQAESEFLANVSHEMRTQLTAILGFADVLLESVAEPQNIDAIKTIRRNGELLLRLITDILDLSKIEAGKADTERTSCSPGEVIPDVVSLLKASAGTKNLLLVAECHGAIPEKIQSDPVRLRQILVNVLSAVIRTTESGAIRLVVRLRNTPPETPKLEIQVVASALEIPKNQLSKLFEPFAQADASHVPGWGGSSLALTISRRLAQLLGGDITVSSIAGKGTTFVLTVATGPLDNVKMVAHPPTAESAGAPADAAVSGEHPLIGARLLLAEDGPDNQRLISFVLWKAGAEVVVAENGQVACELVAAAQKNGNLFDAILMDMRMPVLDGYEATKRLRADGYSKPIIALTANAMKEDRQKCLDAGCDDYVSKPIDRKQLLALVTRYAKPAAVRTTG